MADKLFANDNIKMTGTKKTEYKVPYFLLKNLDNIPDNTEFHNTYLPTKEETPLWWTRDVDLPLTKKENRKASKRAIAIKNALELQKIKTDEANKIFLRIIHKQERDYQKRCEFLEEQINNKKDELEMLEQKNKAEYTNRLLELELDIQNINLEKNYYQKESNRMIELEKISEQTIENQMQRELALATLDEELEKIKKEYGDIKQQVNTKRSQKGLLPIAVLEEEKDNQVEELTYFDNTPIESFDSNNIMEIKYLSLSNKDTGRIELKNISFDVKKQGVTVIFSQSQAIINNIHMSIMRNLPSNIQRIKGDIRVLGESITESLREDYKKRISQLIINQVDVADNIAKSHKHVSWVLKSFGIVNKNAIEKISACGLNSDIMRKRADKLTCAERNKLALCICLSLDRPLVILFEPQEDLDVKDKKHLINVLNSQRLNSAILILTTDKNISANITDSALYSFNNK